MLVTGGYVIICIHLIHFLNMSHPYLSRPIDKSAVLYLLFGIYHKTFQTCVVLSVYLSYTFSMKGITLQESEEATLFYTSFSSENTGIKMVPSILYNYYLVM